MESNTIDFFVSHTGADAVWANWIGWTLEEAGYSVVIDRWDWRPGENFAVAMQQALVTSRHLLAVLSPDYLTATFCQPEWAAAFARDPHGWNRALIPVKVRPCQPDGLLRPILLIDLIGLDQAAAKRRLLDGIGPGRRRPHHEPPFPGPSS